MGYFIHNKYDKDSIVNRAIFEADGHTIIDYYAFLENDDKTYKYIDTSSMGTAVVDDLTYITPEGVIAYVNGGGEFNSIAFRSSIYIGESVEKTWTTHKLIITSVGQYTVQGRINLRGMYSNYWGYKIYINGELVYTQPCYSNVPRRPSMKNQFSTSCSYEHSYPDMLHDFYVNGTIIFEATETSSNSTYAAEAQLVFTYDLWE